MSDTTALGRLEVTELFKLLPHRYPFLLIDRIVDIRDDVSATGIKNVTFNEPHFTGHFPGEPIMPGVLIVEAMAQTCGAIVAHKHRDGVRKLVYFMTIDGAKFRKPVVPGDVLELEVKVLRGSSKIWKFEGRATVNGEMAAEAEFMAMIDLTKRG